MKPPNKVSGATNAGAMVVATTIFSLLALIRNPTAEEHCTHNSNAKYYYAKAYTVGLNPILQYTISYMSKGVTSWMGTSTKVLLK